MRQFYLKYQIFQSVTGKLTWTHYAELLAVSDDNARGFYEKQAINENWSVRELKRQINSSLFERLALSKDKDGILKLAKQGQIITGPKDIVKDPPLSVASRYACTMRHLAELDKNLSFQNIFYIDRCKKNFLLNANTRCLQPRGGM